MSRKSRQRRELSTRPPLQRMLHIHGAIQAGKFPTSVTLAKDLEVCSRSVRRDIEFMRDRLELPIEYDEIRHGYHYTEEVSSFPSLTITEGELLALVVAEKAMGQYRGTSFEKPLMTALGKLSDSLPDTISLNLSQWDQSISFRTSAEPLVNLEIFDALAQATARRQQLRLHYRKPGQRQAEVRVVDPYHLANVNGEWFLFGYDHLRQAIRTFVPARMAKVEKTGERFARNAKFSIEEQLRSSFGVHSGNREIRVILDFGEAVADYIREKKWHPSQKLRALRSGGVQLEMTLSSLVEVERWVLAWGGHAQAVEPVELVENVRSAAERLARGHAAAAPATAPARVSDS